MPSEAKVERLFQTLIRETTEGNLDWQPEEVPRMLTVGTNEVIHEFFVTTFKNQDIAVYERKFQNYDGDRDIMYWTSSDCFAFMDSGRVTWETTQPPFILTTLLKVARESAADVDGILDSLLK